MNETTQVQLIPIGDLVLSKLNPRPASALTKEALAELTASVKARGLDQPITVRPNHEAGRFEVVAGQRRYSACKLAGLAAVPSIVRILSDQAAMECSTVENLQRENLHFLDEAAGFAKLIDSSLSSKDVADRVGKPEVYIHARLALNNLIPGLLKLGHENVLRLGAALKLARLTPKVQKQFLDGIKGDMQEEGADVITSDDVDRFVQHSVYTDLSRAPFDTGDANLVPTAGPCHTCPKRTGSAPMLFADFKNKDVCTDPTCFRSKCDALIKINAVEHPKAIKVYAGNIYNVDRKEAEKQHIILQDQGYGEGGWKPSQAGACESTKEAIVVGGDLPEIGKVKLICAEPKCPVHGKRRAGQPAAPKQLGVLNEERAKQREELWERRTRHAVRLELHAVVRGVQEQQKDAHRDIPLEAWRLTVLLACRALSPNQEGQEYFANLWPVPEKKDDAAHEAHVTKVVRAAKDRSTLTRILVDYSHCQQVNGVFGDDEAIAALATAFDFDAKKVAHPIQMEYDAKKKAEYERRDERLKKERAKLAKTKAAESKAEEPKAIAKEGAAIVHALHTGKGKLKVAKDQTVTLKKAKKSVKKAK